MRLILYYRYFLRNLGLIVSYGTFGLYCVLMRILGLIASHGSLWFILCTLGLIVSFGALLILSCLLGLIVFLGHFDRCLSFGSFCVLWVFFTCVFFFRCVF